ncbi:hypothetical protein VTL71DRAFT_3213 [Oculimacula yallundae]|uniref:Uncharacterized protein n=1 Tax=Oculimacula yallundae TaxID=86028 RepID=A0ABR4C8P8_9HELO
MPLCTIHILSLSVPLSTFLSTLSSTSLKPLTISRIIRWIILPSKLSTVPLLSKNIHWDILLILPSPSSVPLPELLQIQISHQWSIEAGVPSRLLKDYEEKNKRLLKPEQGDVKALTGSLHKLKKGGGKMPHSAQDLELSPELLNWITEFTSSNSPSSNGAVSMLNLLAFKPGLKEEYLKYGKAFAESAGSSRGGEAKIVGSVIKADGEEEWEEMEGRERVGMRSLSRIIRVCGILRICLLVRIIRRRIRGTGWGV